MFKDKILAICLILRLAWADENAGFDVPGPPDDAVDKPTYYVGDKLLIKWHMNFTNALLKLVFTPNDHTSFSSYIISTPTNDTSYEWTVSTLALNDGTDNPEFYFSVYEWRASDASFTSHNIFIVDAEPHTSAPPTVTPITPSPKPAPTPTTTPTSTPASTAEPEGTDKGPTGVDRGVIAGIAIGSVVVTLIVVGLTGWCLWKSFVMKRRAKNNIVQGQQTMEQQEYPSEQYGGSVYPQVEWYKPELPNNEVSELEGGPSPAHL